jgi:two-component system, NtrC family, response regulator PilR
MLSRPVLLVVDDEVDFLTTYRRLLGREGFRVVTAATREEALAALAAERFSLVVTDVRLPDGDGLDVVRAAQNHGRATPTIVVSGFSSRDAREAARAAGATEFIAKPFEAAALAARIREIAKG